MRSLLVLLVLGDRDAALLSGSTTAGSPTRRSTSQRANATIDVARGASYRDIVRQLRVAGVTHASPWYWRALGRELGVEGKLHAGEYALTPGPDAARAAASRWRPAR